MSLVTEAINVPKVELTDEEIFAAHVGGKLSVETTAPLDTQRALSIAYTPGVAQVSRAIAADETLADRYTWTNRLVVVVSDGTAVLGLGDIGPRASLPVMEASRAVQELCRTELHSAGSRHQGSRRDRRDTHPTASELRRGQPRGHLAPRCFEIEKRVIEALDCPVMHDDQHGTAIVVLAALKAP